MQIRSVLILGGSGFLGRHIANRLAQAGIRLTLPSRRYEESKHLRVLPTAEVLEADVLEPATLARLLPGQDAVINLVGVLHSRSGSPYGADFARAHVALPRTLVAAMHAAGVDRLIHVSALGADADGPSQYQRSKAAGEAVVRESGLAWSILRPSVVFGPEDSFANLFAQLNRSLPVLPLAGAHTRFQPVYVGDVAEVVARCLDESLCIGQCYECAGPRVYPFAELVRYIGRLVGHPRPVLPLPEWAAMLQAALMELAPGRPLMSRDNVRSLRRDNIATGAPLPFGLTPTALEAVAPAWLGSPAWRPVRGAPR